MRVWICGLMFLFWTTEVVQAQSAAAYPYRGKIVIGTDDQVHSDEVQIYQKADFDSSVVGTVKAGQIFDISKNTFNGAFYKIRLKAGVLGYIADSNIEPLFKTGKPVVGPVKKPKKVKKPSRRNRSFEFTRFGGLTYALVDFTEETMGGKPHENLGFFGAKISGPNVLLDGLLPVDVNLLYYSGAPSYYEKATGRSASGFVFLGDILFQTYWPQGPNILTYFGFGPMFKYSKFDVELRDTTTSKYQSYSLEDISVGAAFDLGIGFRLGSVALRVDYQYFWEKQMYGGFTGAVQMAF